MNNKYLRIAMAMVMVLCLALCACTTEKPPEKDDYGIGKVEIPDELDDKKVVDDGTNSWENMEKEDYTITWYVDVSSWVQPTGVDMISQKIKEVTGITVEFETPVSDDGQKLGAYIAGDMLPDVVTVQTSNMTDIASLVRDGLIYDINTLADNFAPSLYRNLSSDIWDWWSFANGKTYGIPNHYYSYDDVPDGQLQPNGGMMVRQDLFDAWQEVAESMANEDGMIEYPSRTTGETKYVEWEGYITTPEGFKKAAKWAMEKYYGTGDGQITTGLQLSQFKSDGCISLTWLAQFFAIPFEDEDGNYVYQFTTEAYEDMLLYLNELYKEGIISDANFSQNYDGVGSVIAGGKCFASLATPQDYQIHFQTAKGSGYEYVSMYITNEDGDAPVLADIRGYGYLYSMITTNCERPDLVIKLFDYLCSDEGQRLVAFGVEGETWEWADDAKTTIKYTDAYLAKKAAGEDTSYGLLGFDLLLNYQYYDNMQPKTNNGKTENELYRLNLKRPLTIYSYDYNVTHFIVDVSSSDYNTYSNALQHTNQLLGTQIPKIIRAENATKAGEIYDTTVTALNNKTNNLSLIIQMNSEAYRKTREKLGYATGEAAWPAWQEGYVNPLDRKHPNGDFSYYRSY